ncbi:ATP-binding protein [Actinoplanes sp. CA-054009]
MRLLEREHALASLVEYAAGGDVRLVLVAGEAGIGKTSLVEALRERTGGETRWAWGMCDGLFTPRPLGPLFDLAADLGGEIDRLCRRRAPREELFDALLQQVRGRPHVLVIEDLHWADEATVDLVRFLARRLRDTLLIATYRDDELDPHGPLRIALGRLAALRGTRRINLAPLSAEAVGVLAGDSGLPAAELHRLTGGNPFFVTEVVRSGSTAVPASARDAVLARVAELSAEGRAMLETAALAGSRVDPRLVEAAPLDEVIKSGLLVEDPPWLRFRHELARLAVEQAVPAHRATRAHAAILAALHELGSDDDAQMAFHAEVAGDAEATLRHAVRAADRAAELGAHREAAAQYERALRITESAELYDRLSAHLSLLDRGADQLVAAAKARDLWRAEGNERQEGVALLRLSIALVALCRRREAMVAAEQALAILERHDKTPELARVYAHLATQCMLTDRHAEAIDLAVRAQRAAAELGLPAIVSDALNTQACSLSMSDQPWWAEMTAALEVAREHDLDEQAGRAYTNFYGILTCERRYDEAEPHYEEGITFCDEHDVSTFGTCMRGERTVSLARTDRWDEAARLGRRLITEVEASPINRISPLLGLTTVLVRRGDDEAGPLLDEAAATADGSAEPQWIVYARLTRAEWRWLAGRPEEARREAELADDVAGRGNRWLRGAVAVWLRRTESERSWKSPVAEPFQLFLDGDFAASAERWDAIGSGYEAALSLMASPEEEHLREAVRRFDELGAVPAARRARQLLRVRGVRSVPVGPRAATRAHPAGLTRREHEVLDLIGAGRTNAEIAAHLVLSVKTVDHHVSAVLAKLGAPTRSAAAAKARNLGLLG